MSLHLVPQWLLLQMYDWVDPYRLVCAPTIAGLRPLVYCFAGASADRPLDWNGRRPLGLDWELSALANDWNRTGNRPMLGVDSYPRLYIITYRLY